MTLKVDENLPAECTGILREFGFTADTVVDEGMRGVSDATLAQTCQQESRILITLDLGFADIRSYPPDSHSGIVVLRVKRQDKNGVFTLVQKVALMLIQRDASGELWIVESDRIRFRSQED